ncbi:hypothetical protein [Pelagicoccus sp. SDUM812002]|uniref:hypothetical protein n=1 Tax=Pelagicoccus sp. SDUM812002 TaxID=3041266 RepID=UPI00280D7048|nr:hypothetical protein [Pelagicoccus sp. SDUM812002]MDQ8186904.1 hypothetical protein [Pelagicoccus sp. SDUM812002]
MTLNKPLYTIALLMGTAAAAFSQTANDGSDLEALFWPKSARPELSTRSSFDNFDGIHVPMLLVQSSDLSFELANRENLRINRPSSSRYSGEITDTQLPGITIGLSLFKGGEFLPDLSEVSWSAYRKGLLIEKPYIEIVLENTNIGQAITPYVFGKQFRQIVYQLETTRGLVKRREIFCFVGSNLVVFTISGTKQSVDLHWTAVENLISELSLE